MTLENDRRDRGGQRVPFEALVVVASQKDSSGAYECEAVDVSERGMHLRTAYLPDIGQALTFRFDTGGGEVIAEGMVQWREEQAKGGEFGVKFTRLDDPAIAAIRELCGIDADGSLDTAQAKTQKGSRVRLHIDGLGAPMRARVRDTHSGEVLVGSNLEFLKVGKPIELEDVERGKKRAAVVDRVDVEVDPNSKVPQLVVTLRYDEDAASLPIGAQPIAASAPVETKRTAEPAKSKEPTGAKMDPQVRVASVSKAESVLSDDDNTPKIEDSDEDENTQARFAERAKELAAQVGPKLSSLTRSLSGKVSSLVARVRECRAGGAAEGADEAVEAKDSHDEQAPVVRPRRVTAPPPSGGLTASGRSVVRTEREESHEPAEVAGIEETDENVVKIRRKQRVMIVAAAAVLLLIGGVFASRGSGEATAAATDDAAASEALTAPAAAAVVPAGAALGAQPGANANPNSAGLDGDAITANVPLFGTTPLSTTELAPLPTPSASAAPGPVLAAKGSGEEEGMEEGDEEASADEDAPKGATSFGKGTVTKPRRVGLKMDAPITEIKGSTSGNSFTILLPGRRNIEPASVLAKRDKRLASVKAVPKDGGIAVTFTFKENVPPFMAKANGKMLEIELGQQPKSEDGDTATAKKKSKKHQAVAKKDGSDKKKKTASAADKKKHKDKKKRAGTED